MTESILVQQNLSKRLLEDKTFRKVFLRSRTRNTIASQLRRLRKLRQYKQADLKKKRLHQSGISRIEQANYSSWTYKTLLRVTEALEGVLDINIRPIEEFTAQLAAEEKEEAALAALEEAQRIAASAAKATRLGPAMPAFYTEATKEVGQKTVASIKIKQESRGLQAMQKL